MTPTLTQVKYATRCRVRGCDWEMMGAPLKTSPAGSPDPKTIKYIEFLARHLQEKHPEQYELLGQSFQESFGLLILMNYLVEDPDLHRRFNLTRAQYQRMTQTRTVTDMDIAERAGRFWDLSEDQRPEALLAMMKDLRDLLTERGQYSILDQPAQSIIQP